MCVDLSSAILYILRYMLLCYDCVRIRLPIPYYIYCISMMRHTRYIFFDAKSLCGRRLPLVRRAHLYTRCAYEKNLYFERASLDTYSERITFSLLWTFCSICFKLFQKKRD